MHGYKFRGLIRKFNGMKNKPTYNEGINITHTDGGKRIKGKGK